MKEQTLKAYQGLKKQGAFLLSSPRFGLVVPSTKLPNLTVALPFWTPVTTSEYLNRHKFIPEYYQGPNIEEHQIEYYQQNRISDTLLEVIIFRGI
jgi:hypothetical protein